ncbi:helix-turn-helix domain-containing protein [Spongiactinospora sp. TRM90649]|uniref:helix-turn-helix transcriptional regulator n=1 Tax=Spongiactinospora sp. TRM90649 TaxID=3031114 RepID=UPI0023F6D636|nr:helix-turn-helix domain-containing protein [Spongiactinospora sp. TRM90649]MDF5758548.1 helix-turn-helix domain-containing protein [Spongiactinospora sp. TRM90649]
MARGSDDGAKAGRWTFLTNHARVLVGIARNPEVRLRDVAVTAGITERAAQAIVSDLVSAGYLNRTRVGRRNHYTINDDQGFRHPAEADQNLTEFLTLFTGRSPTPPPTPSPTKPPSTAPRAPADASPAIPRPPTSASPASAGAIGSASSAEAASGPPSSVAVTVSGVPPAGPAAISIDPAAESGEPAVPEPTLTIVGNLDPPPEAEETEPAEG